MKEIRKDSTIINYKSGDGLDGRFSLFSDSFRINVGKEVYVYDLEGRPIFIYFNDRLYVRGLSGVIVEKKWLSIRPKRRLLRKIIDPNERRKIVDYAYNRLIELKRLNLNGKYRIVIDKALSKDYNSLESEAQNFRKIYKPISILPPDQYLSLVLQPVEGCPYNKCSFCTFYRDRKFRFKSFKEFENHVVNVIKFVGLGIHLRKRIFLADANALVTPTNRLVRYIKIIHKYINPENIEGIYTFSDYFHKQKSVSEFLTLKNLGLKRIYIGLESGNLDVLDILSKPGYPDMAIELVKRCKEVGINVGVIILVGAGGKNYYQSHLDDTIKVLKLMPLSKSDIVYLSKLKIFPHTPYFKLTERRNIESLNGHDMDRQMKEFISSLNTNKYGPVIAEYDIDEFVY